jgi:hypothetical protein
MLVSIDLVKGLARTSEPGRRMGRANAEAPTGRIAGLRDARRS